MNWEEKVTLIGIGLTFIVGVVNIIVTIGQSKKNTFINTVTTLRKEYTVKLRELTAEFCSIATLLIENNENSNRVKEQAKYENKLIELSYQLKTMMNPAGYIDWWDHEAILLIDKIVENKNKCDIETLIALMQSWFALEWHGVTDEGKYGNLNSKQKNELRKKYYSEYKNYLNKRQNTSTQHVV